jgi:hypothetical protein
VVGAGAAAAHRSGRPLRAELIARHGEDGRSPPHTLAPADPDLQAVRVSTCERSPRPRSTGCWMAGAARLDPGRPSSACGRSRARPVRCELVVARGACAPTRALTPGGSRIAEQFAAADLASLEDLVYPAYRAAVHLLRCAAHFTGDRARDRAVGALKSPPGREKRQPQAAILNHDPIASAADQGVGMGGRAGRRPRTSAAWCRVRSAGEMGPAHGRALTDQSAGRGPTPGREDLA